MIRQWIAVVLLVLLAGCQTTSRTVPKTELKVRLVGEQGEHQYVIHDLERNDYLGAKYWYVSHDKAWRFTKEEAERWLHDFRYSGDGRSDYPKDREPYPVIIERADLYHSSLEKRGD